ncbi:polysaccharide biosynthesis/export family protein [Epibacterium ulvae]|uniref:polysaccharide biosynthesis/export family protein n=1 Tax=Epibacterium ulvae TaxID=1156985 RepID=UPI00249365AF|nr:polysaccharide biosynthesis/export family protein [Epibacterium ulvae]
MFLSLLRVTSIFFGFLFLALPATAQNAVQMAPGDRLSFWIVGAVDAPRDIPIQPDGTAMLPLVGPLKVEGLTIAQARQKLAAQLRDVPIRLTTADGAERRLGLRSNEVGLDVAQFRPVYVSGDVNLIGEVEYRPNLTARQAIVKANGLLRLNFSAANEIPLGLLSQKARLEQQVENSQVMLHLLIEHYKLLNPETDLASDPLLARVSNIQSASGSAGQIAVQQDLLEREEVSRQNTIQQLKARVDVVTHLEETSQETIAIAEATVARLSTLAEQGLVRTEAMDNARQSLLQAQTRAFEAASERLRLGLEISKLEDAEVTDALEVTADILDDIKKELTQIETAQAQLKVLSWETGQLETVEASAQDRKVKLTLFRQIKGETVERGIRFDDRLLPGDVINVSLQ